MAENKEKVEGPKVDDNVEKQTIKNHFNSHLPSHMVPKRIIFDEMKISHRFKKL